MNLPPQLDYYARCYFKFEMFPSAETTFFGLGPARVSINSAGVLKIDDGVNAVFGSTLNTDVYYRIELRAYTGGTGNTDEVRLRLDGFEDAAVVAADYGSSPITLWEIGRNLVASEDVDSGSWFVDDCGINDTLGTNNNGETTWPGDGSIVHLRPNGGGDLDAGSLSSGGSFGCNSGEARWDCLVALDDGDSWLGLNSNKSTVDMAVEDLALPPNTQVQFVAVGIRFTCESSSPCNHIVGVKSQASGTVASTTTQIPSLNAFIFFTHHDDLGEFRYRHTQYMDPQNTANGWTDATLDTMQLRVATTDGNPDTNVTTMWALVEYQSTGQETEPRITSITPLEGVPGTRITRTGMNFGATQGMSTVTFDSVYASPTAWSPTSITVPVPVGDLSLPPLAQYFFIR